MVKNMVKKKLTAEKRRAQVLNAARTLFASRGYAETTLDAIGSKVGLSRARVVQLFGSKEEIYKAIAREAYTEHPMDKDLAEPMERGDDLGVFAAFAGHILSHYARRRDREILKILMYARMREDNFHRLHFEQKDSLMISRLIAYVSQRIEAGIFKKLDPRVVVFAYQAMVTNLAIYKHALGQMDFVETDDLAKASATIFIEGLKSS